MIKLTKGYAKTYVNDSEVDSWFAAGWKRDGVATPAHEDTRELKDLKKDELKELALKRGIDASRLTKDQIIAALNGEDAPNEEEAAEAPVVTTEEVEEAPVDAPAVDEAESED